MSIVVYACVTKGNRKSGFSGLFSITRCFQYLTFPVLGCYSTFPLLCISTSWPLLYVSFTRRLHDLCWHFNRRFHYLIDVSRLPNIHLYRDNAVFAFLLSRAGHNHVFPLYFHVRRDPIRIRKCLLGGVGF